MRWAAMSYDDWKTMTPPYLEGPDEDDEDSDDFYDSDLDDDSDSWIDDDDSDFDSDLEPDTGGEA